MTQDLYDTSIYIIRVFGWIGFVFLCINLYRLYNIFASPLLRHRSRHFVRAFAVATGISFLLMVSELVFKNYWLLFSTLAFNVGITYVLVIYLSTQISVLNSHKTSAEYKTYVKSMDDFIQTLKYPNTP